MSHLKRLIHETHRRSVWQVLGIYLIGGWIALQVVETLVDSLGLPDWFPAFAVMLLIVGLPIVVATAFVQEGVGGGSTAGSPEDASPHQAGGSAAPGDAPLSGGSDPNMAGGTGSLDRPTTRPPRLYRLLTWKNAVAGGIIAFALWGMIAAGWIGMSAYLDGPADGTAASAGGPGTAGNALSSSEVEALKSVAVLPFSNLSTDEENAFFADGIHEDVLTQLSKVGDLIVISRTSVLAYRDTERPLAEIGQELGVGSIVEGSVRRSGDNVRITAQLIDAETDRHLWADNFDRALTAANVFSIQTEIAQRIAAALSATLSPEEESRLVRAPTDDLAAYEATLRGREAYRMYTAAANDEAIRMFHIAIEQDPVFAEPWAGLADALGQRVLRYGFGLEWADSAEAAARQALELDPELATAYKALGVAFAARGDRDASLDANLRAIELDPNYSDPLNNAGVVYQSLGRLDESHRFTARSYRLQPNIAFARANLALSYAQLGDYELGHRRLDEALRFAPGDMDAKSYKGFVYVLEGNPEPGADILDEVVAQDPDNVTSLAWAADASLFARRYNRAAELAGHSLELYPDQGVIGWRLIGIVRGFALLQLGETEEGEALLDGLLVRRLGDWETGPEGAVLAFDIASLHAARGNTANAIDWLEIAYEQGNRQGAYLAHDPVFDSVRDDPEFQRVLRSMQVDVERMRQDIEREETEAGLR